MFDEPMIDWGRALSVPLPTGAPYGTSRDVVRAFLPRMAECVEERRGRCRQHRAQRVVRSVGVARPVRREVGGAAVEHGRLAREHGEIGPCVRVRRVQPGLRRILLEERRKAGVRRRDLLHDGFTGFRSFG